MRVRLTTISLGLLALSGGALAQDAGSMFSFSGFGTLAAVKTNTDAASYKTAVSQDNGATTSFSTETDSKLGGQVNAKFNDTFSGTLQLLARQDAVASYGPKVEWAFVKAKLSGNIDVRAGRIGAPVFMTSDYRNVGYTNLTMRTPPDVYYAVPISSFDGADLLYQRTMGNTTLNAQFYVGKSSVRTAETTTFLLNDLTGFNLTAESGAFTYRLGYAQTKLGAEGAGPNQLMGALAIMKTGAGGASLIPLTDQISVDGKKASFTGIGIAYDAGNWVGSAEITKRKTDTLRVVDLSGWYTTLGYRIGKVTPYVSLSGVKQDSMTSFAVPGGNLNPFNSLITSTLQDTSQKTVAVGARWEAGKGYAVKGELARVSVPAGSAGLFSLPPGPGGFATDTTINVLSVGVDFVF